MIYDVIVWTAAKQGGKVIFQEMCVVGVLTQIRNKLKFNLILLFTEQRRHAMCQKVYCDPEKLSIVHYSCAWCNSSPPPPSSTCGWWNKFGILRRWINHQAILNKPICERLLIKCINRSKVDYRRAKCSS